MRPLFAEDINKITQRLDAFIAKQHDVIEKVYSSAGEANLETASAFLFQPEALLLYERLANDQFEMQRAWSQQYPESELDRVANQFGIVLE